MVPEHHIRAVLFDLDGVVVFTDRYHYLAWKRLCDEEGWRFDEAFNHRLRGVPRMESLDLLLAHNGIEGLPAGRREELAARKNGYYLEFLDRIDASALYPGVLEFLDQLKKRGLKLGLCSSSKNAATVLARLNLTACFDTVVTGADIAKAKPDPEIFLLAARRLRVPAFHCLVFEDAVSGIAAALAARMKPVGVGRSADLPNAPECIEDYAAIDIDSLLDTGRPHRLEAEPWAVTQTAIRPHRLPCWETIFALTNGLIGVRGSLEEENPAPEARVYAGTFLNGIYAYQPYHHIWSFPGFAENLHAMVRVCDWTIVNLTVDGHPFGPSNGTMIEHRRHLDLQRGLLVREALWRSPSGAQVRLRTERLVSMPRRHAAALRYQVTAVDPCRIRISTRTRFDLETQTLDGAQIRVTKKAAVSAGSVHLLKTIKGPFSVAAGFSCAWNGLGDLPADLPTDGSTPPSKRVEEESRTANLAAGEVLTLEKSAVFFTTVETAANRLTTRTRQALGEVREAGFTRLREEQAEWWARYWAAADIVIEGESRDQQALRFSLFHLRQSHPEDPKRSIGANGQTGDKYCGHVFWDTEMYLAPHFLSLDPALVKPLLMYRYNLLPRARERAAQMQGRGALYSWNSISGEECCVVFEAATAEYHLQSAIAWCLSRYVEQSGDRAFLRDFGAEILFETARFLENRGAYIAHKGGRFCLNAVCGPDEYGCGVNNNCYTNCLAQWHFRYAARVYEELRAEAPEQWAALCTRLGFDDADRDRWANAAEMMYIPFNAELGIHEQDDSFLSLDPADMEEIPRNTDLRELFHPLNLWRLQVAKQADVVLLMFVLGHQFPLEVKRANYAFYEPRTCHGSSLSASIHSIMASETGRPEDAYRYFRESALMDLNDFKNNTANGIHSACLGGTWMAVVNGFGGLRDYPGGLFLAPRLPRQWSSYSFSIRHRQARLAIRVDSRGVQYRLLEGEILDFHHAGQPIHLTSGQPESLQPPVPPVV